MVGKWIDEQDPACVKGGQTDRLGFASVLKEHRWMDEVSCMHSRRWMNKVHTMFSRSSTVSSS